MKKQPRAPPGVTGAQHRLLNSARTAKETHSASMNVSLAGQRAETWAASVGMSQWLACSHRSLKGLDWPLCGSTALVQNSCPAQQLPLGTWKQPVFTTHSPQANASSSKKILKSHNAGSWFLQNSEDAVVAELLVTRKSRFERGLDFCSWVPRKGDLIFENLET